MSRLSDTKFNKQQRQLRVRAIISGTKERPRLSVNISNRHITAQIIDDSQSQTLAAVTTAGKKAATGTLTEKAAWVGEEIAKKAKTAKVKKVVFDRGGFIYTGNVKALADGARAGGLKF